MDRFVIKDEFGFGLNCKICSRLGHCSGEDCIQELYERLYKYEQESFELEKKIEKLKSHSVLGKFLK